jgi:hypothetical protein
VHRADLGAVTELQCRRDDVDDECREEFPQVVVIGVARVTVYEAEVERRGEDDDEAEDDFLEVPGGPVTAAARALCYMSSRFVIPRADRAYWTSLLASAE